jgi:formylmethanofuran dehydrogenase subunit E-like metal-binding protein
VQSEWPKIEFTGEIVLRHKEMDVASIKRVLLYFVKDLKNVTARQATDDNTIRRMRFACWIAKATDTHSEYVILIVFTRQQWLRERASMLRLYVHCLSFFLNCAPLKSYEE